MVWEGVRHRVEVVSSLVQHGMGLVPAGVRQRVAVVRAGVWHQVGLVPVGVVRVGAVRAVVWHQVGLVRVAVVRVGAVRAGVWHQVGLVPAPVRHQVVVVSSDVPHLGFPQEEGVWVVRLQEVVSETSQRSLSLHPLNL